MPKWLIVLLLTTSAYAQKVVVAINQEDSAMVLNGKNHELIAKLPAGLGPHEIAVSRDGRYAYVANSGHGPNRPPGNSVTVLDLKQNTVRATWSVGDHRPHDVAVSRDGKRLWVASAPTKAVLEIDTSTGKVTREWNTGREGGWMLVATPDDKKIYVAHLEQGGISAIDLSTGKLKHIETATGEMGFAVSPDGRELWAANFQNHTISIIDVKSDTVSARIESGGKQPLRVRFTPDGKKALIPIASPPQVAVFDVAGRKVIDRIKLHKPPKIIAVSPNGKKAFVSHPSDDLVSVIDVAAQKVIASAKTGKQPDGVAVTRN
jgi:YVTN family beta-propeller protein